MILKKEGEDDIIGEEERAKKEGYKRIKDNQEREKKEEEYTI
jgi:hypothetical protein